MSSEIKIRRAVAEDLSEILALFVGSVNQVGRQHYEPEQLKVWAASVENKVRWQQAINNQYFLVATVENAIAGFASLSKSGYLDFLYTHKDHQRKGVAHALYQSLEKEALRSKHRQITTDASKTAQGFFLRQGYDVLKENRKTIKGVEIINYRMVKVL